MTNENHNDGYRKEGITISKLYESRNTHEPSEKALRERARGDILVFVESKGNIYYYDRILSTIRVNAARRCKKPGVKWSDIKRAMKNIDSLDEILVEQFNQNGDEAVVIEYLVGLLSKKLALEG